MILTYYIRQTSIKILHVIQVHHIFIGLFFDHNFSIKTCLAIANAKEKGRGYKDIGRSIGEANEKGLTITHSST